jgi:molybdopterin molybdotransferase
MDRLTALDDCLAQALRDLAPLPAEVVPLAEARGHVLAEDLRFPADTPSGAEALRAGYAVTALDLTGASTSVPVPLVGAARVLPGDALPPGTDAVLPEDGVEAGPSGPEAIRAVGPGEGVRRAGHDGREGALIAPAGARLDAHYCLVAGLAGAARCVIRRPRVAVALPDPAQAAFASAWMAALGAVLSDDAPDLVLRAAEDPRPRLALAPGETAWLAPEGRALVLSVPRRVDGMVAACLALGLPALAALTGAAPATEARPLARKAASALGLSEIVLLAAEDGRWRPAPPGSVTLSVLALADAFALLPPDSEGLPEGAMLPATPLLAPFG